MRIQLLSLDGPDFSQDLLFLRDLPHSPCPQVRLNQSLLWAQGPLCPTSVLLPCCSSVKSTLLLPPVNQKGVLLLLQGSRPHTPPLETGYFSPFPKCLLKIF